MTWTQIGGSENGGVGEIRSLGDALGSVAGISPMHGNQLVIFHPPAPGADAATAVTRPGRREVLDDGLIDGHAWPAVTCWASANRKSWRDGEPWGGRVQ